LLFNSYKIKKKKAYEYLKSMVNPIIEKLVIDLLINRSEEPLQFMLNWISTKIDENKPRKCQFSICNNGLDDANKDASVSLSPGKTNCNTSTQILTETFVLFNQKKEFKPIVFAKTPSQVLPIEQIVSKSFIFNNLNPQELKIVIDAMQERIYNT
jgi:hypothetical protein